MNPQRENKLFLLLPCGHLVRVKGSINFFPNNEFTVSYQTPTEFCLTNLAKTKPANFASIIIRRQTNSLY